MFISRTSIAKKPLFCIMISVLVKKPASLAYRYRRSTGGVVSAFFRKE